MNGSLHKILAKPKIRKRNWVKSIVVARVSKFSNVKKKTLFKIIVVVAKKKSVFVFSIISLHAHNRFGDNAKAVNHIKWMVSVCVSVRAFVKRMKCRYCH